MKILSVRLPESELREFKSLAATRGITVQQAVHEALDTWAGKRSSGPSDPLAALEGSLIGVDVDALRRKESDLEENRDRRWM